MLDHVGVDEAAGEFTFEERMAKMSDGVNERAVLLFSLPECKRFPMPTALSYMETFHADKLNADVEKSPLLPGNIRWFYLALLSGPELRHRAKGTSPGMDLM